MVKNRMIMGGRIFLGQYVFTFSSPFFVFFIQISVSSPRIKTRARHKEKYTLCDWQAKGGSWPLPSGTCVWGSHGLWRPLMMLIKLINGPLKAWTALFAGVLMVGGGVFLLVFNLWMAGCCMGFYFLPLNFKKGS